MNLNELAAQRAGAEARLEGEVGWISKRASYRTSFAAHKEFHVDHTEDDMEVPPDNFGLALNNTVAAPRNRVPTRMTRPGWMTTAPQPTQRPPWRSWRS